MTGRFTGPTATTLPDFLPLEAYELICWLCFVGTKNQSNEISFLLLKLLLSFLLPKSQVDSDIVCSFVFAKVENLKGSEIFPLFLEFTLNLNQALAGSMDGKLAKIGIRSTCC